MMSDLLSVFDTGNFEAHGVHFSHVPGLYWTFIIANIATFVAYSLIPLSLIFFVLKRRDLKFSWLFLLFGAFIVLCGIHHLIHAITFWYPIYGIEAVNDVIMALVSLGTFAAMIYVIPIALQLRSPDELEVINKRLTQEMHTRMEQEKTLQSTLDALNAVALVSMTDVKGNITYANDKFVAVSKYSREELIGQNHRILKSGHQPQEMFNDLWRTVSSGKTWRGEIQNKAKDGSSYWVDTSIASILNDLGVPERYVAIRFLITDKKEAEFSLRNAVADIQKFELAVERSNESIVITDTKGIIQYVNKKFTTLTGYSREEAIGKNPRILQSGKTPSNVYDSMWSLISKGETFMTDELINKRKDGSEYYADIAIYPVMEGKKPQFFVAMQRDVTQRKKEERAKAEFVSIASHQLRTPLTAIRWSLGRFRKKTADKLDPSLRELLDAATAAGKRMSETINAMLNMSRLAAGKIKPESEDVHLCDALEEMRKEVEPLYANKQIALSLTCMDGWSMQTDPNLLKEIIGNLLTNAVKYTPPKGSVSVRVARNEQSVTIDVADTGYGIPKDQQEKIFTKFFRADNVLDKEPDGNGLGLYLVKELTLLLGGNVTFVSEQGKGTTFTVTLPLALHAA